MPPIEIWSGGQTGVDTGGARAALDAGVPLAGFMPADAENEEGPISFRIAHHLRRHDRTNPAARTAANVGHADVVLVVVEDRRRAGATRGTALTIRLATERQERGTCRLLVVDGAWPRGPGSEAYWSLIASEWSPPRPGRHLRVLVAGPRASLWPDGERVAYEVVAALLRGTATRRGA